MNVWVYPEINCSHDGTRWHLHGPRDMKIREIIDDLRPPIEHRSGPYPGPSYRIPGALWKRADGFFDLAEGSDAYDRYDPAKINDYNVEAGCDVDGTYLGQDEKGKKVFCGPNNEKTISSDVDCAASLPRLGTERIEVILLEPANPERAGQKIGSSIPTNMGEE